LLRLRQKLSQGSSKPGLFDLQAFDTDPALDATYSLTFTKGVLERAILKKINENNKKHFCT
jgi:hypothetical protein